MISVISESIYVNSEVTDICYLHQNNFFQKNLEEEHTEVPNLSSFSIIYLFVDKKLVITKSIVSNPVTNVHVSTQLTIGTSEHSFKSF